MPRSSRARLEVAGRQETRGRVRRAKTENMDHSELYRSYERFSPFLEGIKSRSNSFRFGGALKSDSLRTRGENSQKYFEKRYNTSRRGNELDESIVYYGLESNMCGLHSQTYIQIHLLTKADSMVPAY